LTKLTNLGPGIPNYPGVAIVARQHPHGLSFLRKRIGLKLKFAIQYSGDQVNLNSETDTEWLCRIESMRDSNKRNSTLVRLCLQGRKQDLTLYRIIVGELPQRFKVRG
jgi:hypothetical protein